MLFFVAQSRPVDEYHPESPRSVALRNALARGVAIDWMAALHGLTERQTGYLLAIRDQLIREETSEADSAV